jgi:uncharacterized protein YndB with AHSA1/START domain
MPYTFTLTASIPATPEEIYQAWLDSLAHSEMTGGEATMSDQIGAEVSAWDGYISGRNVELIPSERIVQSWRTSEFDDEDEDSVITVVLEPVGGETLLTLEHSNVPDEYRSYEEGGWESNYFEPMIAYFAERNGKVAEPAPRQARKSVSKAAPKSTPKPKAESAGRTKRTVSAKKAKPAASRAKASPNKASPNKPSPNKTSPNKGSPKKAAPKKSGAKGKTKGKTKGKAGAAAARSRTKPRSSKRSGGKGR